MTVLVVPLAYFIGSIPVAWIVTKVLTGKDLREVGSGNVGVMNVALSVARWAGLLVFFAEASKGILTVLLVRALGGNDILIAGAVIATVVGTRWPIWLRGEGGRGNTAGAGAVLLIAWPVLPIGGVIWLLARVLTGTSFWATRISLFVMPFLLGWISQSWWIGLFGMLLSGIYLSTQHQETDDHLIIKKRWPSLWAFLTGPPRKSR